MLKISKILSCLLVSLLLCISCSNSSDTSSNSTFSEKNGSKENIKTNTDINTNTSSTYFTGTHCSKYKDFIKSSTGDFKEEVLGFIVMSRSYKELTKFVNQEEFPLMRKEVEQKDQMDYRFHYPNNSYTKTQYSESDIDTFKQACLKYQDLEKMTTSQYITGYKFKEEDSGCILDTFQCVFSGNTLQETVSTKQVSFSTRSSSGDNATFSTIIKEECQSIINLNNTSSSSNIPYSSYTLVSFSNSSACDCLKQSSYILGVIYRECHTGEKYKFYYMTFGANKPMQFSSKEELLNTPLGPYGVFVQTTSNEPRN